MSGNKLEGRVALITGAGRGIGAAIAQLCGRQGAAVAVNDIDETLAQGTAEQIRTDGGRATACIGSVTDESFVVKMVAQTTEEFGGLHILVNNAGVLRATQIEQITSEEYDLVIDVCMKSCFLCSREAIPVMKRQRWGRIVNVSSSAGRSVSTLGGCHYTAAKAGMLGLTRAIAKEAAPFGITVNAVCPGLIDTEMVRDTISPERTRQYADSFPIPRLGAPEEVADLVLFLASDESSYLTGASIDINGGDLMI